MRFQGNSSSLRRIGLYPRPGAVGRQVQIVLMLVILLKTIFRDCEDAIGRPIDPSANQSDTTGLSNIKFTAFEKNHLITII